MDENESLTPPDIVAAAMEVSSPLLPAKSRNKYLAAYAAFMEYRKRQKTESFSENILLVYFKELSERYKASSLWSIFSMLRCTLNIHQSIDINSYRKLLAFLKSHSDGYSAKKTKVFTPENVEKFLTEAPDHQFLAAKVVLIFGLTGACRCDELVNLKVKDIETHGEILVVNVPVTKSKISRKFTISGAFAETVKKYKNLRPSGFSNDRFFVNYHNGKCTCQVIGINKFSSMPKIIATYLKLPDANLYTGHSFRRTSATLLADAGADITTLRRHGGWRSDAVAQGYIEESVKNKQRIGDKIMSSINVSFDHGYRMNKGIEDKMSDSDEEDENSQQVENDYNATQPAMEIKEEPPEDILDYGSDSEKEDHSFFENSQSQTSSTSLASPSKRVALVELDDLTEDLFYFGRYIAAQLRRMSTFNAIKCQKAISDIISDELLGLINPKSSFLQFEPVTEQPNIPAKLKIALIPPKAGLIIKQSENTPHPETNSIDQNIISRVPSTSNSVPFVPANVSQNTHHKKKQKTVVTPPSKTPAIQTVPNLSTTNMTNLQSISQQALKWQPNQLSVPPSLTPGQYYVDVNNTSDVDRIPAEYKPPSPITTKSKPPPPPVSSELDSFVPIPNVTTSVPVSAPGSTLIQPSTQDPAHIPLNFVPMSNATMSVQVSAPGSTPTQPSTQDPAHIPINFIKQERL